MRVQRPRVHCASSALMHLKDYFELEASIYRVRPFLPRSYSNTDEAKAKRIWQTRNYGILSSEICDARKCW